MNKYIYIDEPMNSREEQVSMDSSTDGESCQPQSNELMYDVSTQSEEIYEHPTTCSSEADTNDLPPRFAEEICLPTTPVSGTNKQIAKHSVGITTPEKIPELFYETIPISTVVIPPVNHYQIDQLSESAVEQIPEITHDQIQQTAQVKRAKRRLNLGKLPQTVLRAQEEQEPDQLSKDCLDIPKNSAEFIYHQARIPIAVNQFHNSTFLGRGKFGSAHSVSITEPLNMSMAVKRIPFRTDIDSRLSIYAERRAMEKIGSERTRYIVDYYCSMIDPDSGDLCICMELMDTTVAEFYPVLHSLNLDVSDKLDLFVRRCAHDVTRGLHFLETESIVHRDVKPTNMLINERAVIKLCDFGICGHLTDNTYDFSVCVGTTAYLPPKPEKCTIQNDMWALGISLLEIIDGKQPFAHHPTYGIDFKIAAWKPTVPTTISINIQKFILQLLKIAAQDRPRSYLELINKSFIVNMTEIPSSEEIDFVQRIINIISPSRCLNG